MKYPILSKIIVSIKIISILCILLLVAVIINLRYNSDDSRKYLKDLKSENIKVKNAAIQYLGKGKEKKAVPTLIEIINTEQPKEIKISAIEASGKIASDRFVGPLIEVLGERDRDIRIAAIDALGRIKDPKSIPYLIEVLENKDIQLYVIRALSNVGNKDVVPVLTKLLDGPDKNVSYYAAQALKKIGKRK